MQPNNAITLKKASENHVPNTWPDAAIICVGLICLAFVAREFIRRVF